MFNLCMFMGRVLIMFLRLVVVGVCVFVFVLVIFDDGAIKGFLFSIVNYILYVLRIFIMLGN